MRKLEGIVKEIVEEMDFLKKREERFQSTNGNVLPRFRLCLLTWTCSIDKPSRAKFRLVHNSGAARARRMADNAPTFVFQAKILD